MLSTTHLRPALTGFARRAGAYARSVPGTLVWLTALAVTTLLAGTMSDDQLAAVLTSQSTNLDNLASRPIEVMIGSAIWDGHAAWWFLLVFAAFHARVERWLGTWRWLTVVLGAHVIGTLISQGVVAIAIARGALPTSMAGTDDYGVSYTLAGAIGVLAYRFAPTGRVWYAAAVLAVYSVPFWLPAFGPATFTDIGHLTALVVGLGAYPLVARFARRARTAPIAYSSDQLGQVSNVPRSRTEPMPSPVG
ncbi:MAG: hypothetical protein KJ548_12780 [Actinobacteria bacterium]|nr:hypothetical protein [Actinomycetota bacterium]MCG2799168.1 hypothetical protein [Cellulomonas sp.]